jgi:anti-sigma regulatory factor (Ser/Thr protein kinase)
MKSARSFQHAPESVTAARRFATQVLQGVAGQVLETIELMVSELASNCIRHTGAGFELAILQTPDEIRVEATDNAGGVPTKRSPEPTDPSGRGLQIIDMLSTAWGVDRRSPIGKTVWFTIDIRAPAALGESPATP